MTEVASWSAQTCPDCPRWGGTPAGFRRWESSTLVGAGDAFWERASREVLTWGVKTRSGFSVVPDTPVGVGDRPVIVARALWFSVREPVEVIAVVETNDRVGFAYRTLPGHPVTGEEAFVVHRSNEGVTLTIRSLTRPSGWWRWRLLYPVLLVLQARARRRYQRALTHPQR